MHKCESTPLFIKYGIETRLRILIFRKKKQRLARRESSCHQH